MTSSEYSSEQRVDSLDAQLRSSPQHELEGSGVVLLVDREGVIQHASLCSDRLLELTAEQLVGTSIADLMDSRHRPALRGLLSGELADFGWRPMALRDRRRIELHAFAASSELIGFDLLIEQPDASGADTRSMERVAAWNERFLSCQSTSELLTGAAVITGERGDFDGVWVTQLSTEGHGTIVAAHAASPETIATVGQRVPASDLLPGQPQVAGRMVPLYLGDTDAETTELCPTPAFSVDLQASFLHRPFPRYVEGLSRSGIRALASIPLVIDGRLWGRITAAAPRPVWLSPSVQAELRLLGAAVSDRLAEISKADLEREQRDLAQAAALVLHAAAKADDLAAGLLEDPIALCAVCDGDSAIIATADRIMIAGQPLQPAVYDRVIASAKRALNGALPTELAAETALGDPSVDPAAAAGFLAIRITPGGDDLIIWTRREERRSYRLLQRAPTAEFPPINERIQELSGHCRPWTQAQRRQAMALHTSVGELLASRYAVLAQLNDGLARSNAEYDAFTHAAAHDLRAPIRSIHLTAEFLRQDLETVIGPEQRGQIDSILRMSAQMRTMLDDLMTYAQLGKARWERQRIPLQDAVAQAIEVLGDRASHVTVTVAPREYLADPTALQQLLLNLLGNAAKYSGDNPSHVEVQLLTVRDVLNTTVAPAVVRQLDPDSPVLVVADNGIGIDSALHEQAVTLFRQLDTTSDGSGAGLALCRLIARRYGGEIWLRSAPNQGTTVYVAIGDPPSPAGSRPAVNTAT